MSQVQRVPLLLLGMLALLISTIPTSPTSGATNAYAAADPAIASYAQNVINRMAQYQGQYIISGQQEVHWDSSRKDEMSNAIYNRTNPRQYPGLRGWDFPFGGAYANDAQWMIDAMISDWNNAKVLPTISQHWTPYGSQGSNHDDMFVQVNINNMFVDGTTERSRYLTWRSNIADDLQKLENASVPVLWRPYHEAGGGWFWWDKTGSTNYKRLWNDLWDYLTNSRGLHNLIWVWSAGTKGVGTDWYPSGKVDILGHDIYNNSSADYSSWYTDLARFDSSKLRALTEVDHMLDPAALNNAPFAFFMTWHTDMFYRNSDSKIQSVYQHSKTVNRSRISQYLNGSLSSSGTNPTATPISSSSTLYNFEGSTQGWSAANVNAGPWSVNEWAANGSSSLKADVSLGNRSYDLKLTQAHNFSGKSQLQARVRHAAWGNLGSGMSAKLYIKVGSNWAWYDGGAVTINSGSTTTLTLNLSGIANLGSVNEIGVSFSSPTNSSGTSAIYLDYVTLQ